MKNYYCYWTIRPYYGINARWEYWYSDYDDGNIPDNVDGRERLILELKALLKYDDYQKKFLPASEFMDFIDMLSNNLNGEDLYKNFCENCEYLDSLIPISLKQNIYDKFANVFYPNFKGYNEGCALRIFNKNVKNLLKRPNKFKEWVKKIIKQRNDSLYKALCDEVKLEELTIITLKEFFESDETLAIHCDTEEKANMLLRAFDKMGKTWTGGKCYLEDNNWLYYKERTCYTNDGMCCNKKFYLDNDCKVYEFEDVILEDGNYMNNNVKKIFEMLNVEPKEKFKITSSTSDIWTKYTFYINKYLDVISIDNGDEYFAPILGGLLSGHYSIIKLSKVKKKKLRDLTNEEYIRWVNINCGSERDCENCPFYETPCNCGSQNCWIKHKAVYNDKFLDQEIEISEEV